MRVGPHATRAFRREVGEFRAQFAGLVEKFFGFVALHPVFQNSDVLRFGHVAHGHLMRAERARHRFAVDDLRPGPTFGCAEHDHRPGPALLEPFRAGVLLDGRDFGNHRLQRGGHEPVHLVRFLALDPIRFVAVPAQEGLEFALRNAAQDGRSGDLVAVEV